MVHAIIIAGGVGSRMHLDIPKQYLEVQGKPILLYSVEKFITNPNVDTITLVINSEWLKFVEDHIKLEQASKPIIYAAAGNSREQSVYNGLKSLVDIAAPQDIVLVHDSVRPLVEQSLIDRAINECRISDGILPVVKVKSAIVRTLNGKYVTDVLPKDELCIGQSPEAFHFQPFLDAHINLPEDIVTNSKGCTELATSAGLSVRLIEGHESNIKITTREDLILFEELLLNQ